ncbi:MAG: hypothetical protein ACRD3Q_12740 [Terriglobales bacterium]
MKNKSLFLPILLGSLLLAANLVAQTVPDLTIKCGDVKVKGAVETDAYAVNNKNAIAGDYVDSSNVQHGMILKGKVLTTFDGPTGSSTIAAYGLNTVGVAVGWYVDSTGVNQGFAFANGTLTSFNYPGAGTGSGQGTQNNGINDPGWIVGNFFDKSGVQHGFYWDTTTFHKVDAPNASATAVWAINNNKLMTVWEIDTSGVYHSFLYDGTTFTPMDVPGAAQSVVHGINNKGDLDYTIFDSSSNRHGVLYQATSGNFTQFDDPKGANTTRADGINDKDKMVGRYSPSSGTPANAGFKCTVKP